MKKCKFPSEDSWKQVFPRVIEIARKIKKIHCTYFFAGNQNAWWPSIQ